MMNIMKKRSMRRIFAGILCMGVLFTGAVPCSASAPLGYDEYGDPIVTATPVPDAQTAESSIPKMQIHNFIRPVSPRS